MMLSARVFMVKRNLLVVVAFLLAGALHVAAEKKLVDAVAESVISTSALQVYYVKTPVLPETSNIVALKYSKAPSLMVDDYGDSGDCDFAELVKEKSNVVVRFVHPDSKQTFVVQVAHGVAVGKKQPSLTVVHIYGAWDKIPASVLALVKKNVGARWTLAHAVGGAVAGALGVCVLALAIKKFSGEVQADKSQLEEGKSLFSVCNGSTPLLGRTIDEINAGIVRDNYLVDTDFISIKINSEAFGIEVQCQSVTIDNIANFDSMPWETVEFNATHGCWILPLPAGSCSFKLQARLHGRIFFDDRVYNCVVSSVEH